ncbi:MAG: DUF4214 domain-containing protein [Clostridia bacterium]|nr:DUF4214 domain-containing protein [Clostridia bacterium]
MNRKAKIMAPMMSAVMLLGMGGDLIAPNGLGLITSQTVFADEVNPAELDVGAFVNRCYEVALSREADEAGFNYWVNMLNNGQACGAQVGYGFIFSDEYANKNTDNTQFVKDMYQMFFGREPDEEGFNYWLNLLNEGKARDSIFAGFANSIEFFNLCSKYGVVAGFYVENVPNDQQGGVNCFVARLYKSCLGRLPDQAGQAGWVTKLINKEETGASIAEKFIFSAELENRQLSNIDLVKVMYDAFFGREADPEGLAAWTEKLEGGANKKLIFKGFVESAEFDNLCNSYGIERGSINNEGVQIAQGSEDDISGIDRMINYFYDNVIKENKDIGDGITLISDTNYYDEDRLTFLSVYGFDDALEFCYEADGERQTSVSIEFNKDTTWVKVSLDFPYMVGENTWYVWPISFACDIDNVDEIMAHITEPDYQLSDGYQVKYYAYYASDLITRLKEMPNLKSDMDLTYASFVKAFEKGLKYWGTSKEAYGLTFGSDYANYPTTGYTSYDYRNGLISYADSGMNWIDYMKYVIKFLNNAINGDNNSNLYYFYGPDYRYKDEGHYTLLEYLDEYSGFSLMYKGGYEKISDDCDVELYLDFISEDEVELSFYVESDFVPTETQGMIRPTNSASIGVISCKPKELMSILSSPETLKNNPGYHFACDGDNPISEEEILNIFFSEIDSIMKNFEYVFNYCGTSFKDAGIDL